MRTHVGLLRGVNVGGRNLLSMADLRGAAADAGFASIATLVQSGNVVFSAPDDEPALVAAALEQAIAERSEVRPAVIAVPRQTLRNVVDGNPFPQDLDPKRLHVGFYRDVPDAAARIAIHEAAERAACRGARDQIGIDGACVFLRTPDGLGRSILAAELGRAHVVRATGVSTMRNWSTVTRLMALLEE